MTRVTLIAEGRTIGYFTATTAKEAAREFIAVAAQEGIPKESIIAGEKGMVVRVQLPFKHDAVKYEDLCKMRYKVLEHYAIIEDIHGDVPMQYTFEQESFEDTPGYHCTGVYND